MSQKSLESSVKRNIRMPEESISLFIMLPEGLIEVIAVVMIVGSLKIIREKQIFSSPETIRSNKLYNNFLIIAYFYIFLCFM